jgi:hypothetical protein
VEVREERPARPESRHLRQERLLDLENELALRPHFIHAGQDGAHGGELFIADAAARAGPALHEHAMGPLSERMGASRGQRHTQLARLDLSRYADDHRDSSAWIIPGSAGESRDTL